MDGYSVRDEKMLGMSKKSRGSASFALSCDDDLQIEKNLNQHLLNQQYVIVWLEDTQPLRFMRNGVELFSIQVACDHAEDIWAEI